MPNFTFIGAEIWEYSPQNCQNFEFGHKFPPGVTRLPDFYEILRFCTRLQVDFKFLLWLLSGYRQISYKHFPAEGAFFVEFSIAPTGQTTDRIKKSWGGGAKTGRTFSITMPSTVGIVGRAPAVDEKVLCFLFVFFGFLSRFGITKFVITETL